MKLTMRQKEILDFIASYNRREGFSPSYREIMQAFDFSSVASVFKHIQSLEAKGHLQKEKKRARATKLCEKKEAQTGEQIPIIGQICKGKKIELFAKHEYLQVMCRTVSCSYAFRIQDHSFSDLAINQNDLILIAPADDLKADDMLLATDEQGLAFLGSYTKNEGSISPLGKVVALIRNF